MHIIIKIIKITFLLIAIQFLMSSSCNKDRTGCLSTRTTYYFSVTSTWSPEREIYHVGDTIFLKSSFPKILQDQVNPSRQVNYSNSTGIQGYMAIFYLDSLLHGGKDSFSFFSTSGKFIEQTGNQSSGINYSYTEKYNSYEFEGGIICRKKGIYTISIPGLLSRGIKGKNCTKAGFAITLTNNKKNLHLHEYFLKVDSTDPAIQKTVYDFRVE